MRDDIVALGQDELVFVAQHIRQRADEIEQAFAAGFDMGDVLNIPIGPVSFSRNIVTPIEKRIECFEDKRLVLFS